MPRRTVAVLSTDTTHHRYFLNEFHSAGIELQPVLFETTSVQAPFAVGPLFEEEQEALERNHWAGKLGLAGFEIREVPSVNEAEAHALLKEAKPDLGLVFGTRKLSRETITLFRDGLINVHRGISQDYRGLDSDLWAIYHQDYAGLGVTLHRVDAQLDTGNVVAQERLALKRGMKIHHIRLHTSEMATQMMIKAVKDYLAGVLEDTPQERMGRYYSFMPLDLKKIVRKRFNWYCEQL